MWMRAAIKPCPAEARIRSAQEMRQTYGIWSVSSSGCDENPIDPRAPCCGSRGLPVGEGQGEAEDGAALEPVLRPDAAAVGIDDRAHDRQAQSRAMRLGGEERLEHV